MGTQTVRGKVTALIGAQFGSEAKGSAAYSLRDYDVHVRVGAPNAGHTLWHEGREWKMRSVPCGWTNPEAQLVIGAGAMVDVHLLLGEIEDLEAAGYSVRDRLWVDKKAGIISDVHAEYEGGIGGYAHEAIGSTGEGVGIARMAKIARGTVSKYPFEVFWQAEKDDALVDAGVCVVDTVTMLNKWIRSGLDVLLEGAQGSGLSLTHGQWPYVTSTDTNCAQLLADCGIAPSYLTGCLLVTRTYPIRVAGNSGPLSEETTWEALGQRAEQTTVTKKVRRVGKFDPALFRRAVLLNRPHGVVLTFLDYVLDGVSEARTWDELPQTANNYVKWFERDHLSGLDHQCKVVAVGVRPEDGILWRGVVR